jgi:superfamily II DNA or RNA helicase
LTVSTGLGKTIQLAAFINLLATKLNKRGPFLIIAPLSTITHWQRECTGWTELNTIVYHGSAKDRELIRQLEMAYEPDRPGYIRPNEFYLRKCSKNFGSCEIGNPWMAELVITTPELLCADDYVELTAIKWEVLVVDEAHRLKNHNSKFAVNLRDHRFEFGNKILMTGTPIQNTMEELFALLSFAAPSQFIDIGEFMEKYGDMKSKERIDELHEEIRPYILRRLKEDVEKSVPPKEETLIEVELTVAQKQYYRALYEKNVKFLHKNKKKAVDGPSLNNLAMQLRKCCNHLFLLNGIEEEFRAKQLEEGNALSEGDLLVASAGKLVLLDKLLPRLKENGHRILMFSQFKIMLDVLQDYLHAREMKFERIDGSITGKQRQQAIDRFQAPSAEGKEQPFIMLLSTRAGGVGINLTAADTCIIFDSDWNPQNDLQAQARCHRIGQTKSVKVYRLLTRKTYEMQMFHMSSLKMGLDQAVLSGFEAAGPSRNGSQPTKEEIERLLRHGAYGIFNEDNEGVAESNAFVQQDIDTILERRSRTVIYENTGSHSVAAGGTFSKARFTAPKAAGAEGSTGIQEDIDVEDPDFWRKVLGEGPDEEEEAEEEKLPGKRSRTVSNYSEAEYDKKTAFLIAGSDEDDEEIITGLNGNGEDDGSFQQGDESEDDDDDDDLSDSLLAKRSARVAPARVALASPSAAADLITPDPRATTTVVLHSADMKIGVVLGNVKIGTTTSSAPKIVPAVLSVVPSGLAAAKKVQPGMILLGNYEGGSDGVISRIQKGPYPIEFQFYDLGKVGDYESNPIAPREALLAAQQKTSKAAQKVVPGLSLASAMSVPASITTAAAQETRQHPPGVQGERLLIPCPSPWMQQPPSGSYGMVNPFVFQAPASRTMNRHFG